MQTGNRKYVPSAILALILIGYASIQISFFSAGCREPDTAGYLIMAERIAFGKPLLMDEDPFRFHSHVWVEPVDGQVTPKYPPGFPALMAIGYRLFGEKGAFMISPLAGGITLVGAYLLFSLWMSQPAALAGVFALSVNSMFLTYSGYPLTHALNICCVTWGMYFLWRWTAQQRPSAGLAAGLLLGFTPMVRASSVMFVLPAAAAVIWVWIENRREIRRLWLPTAAFAAGFLLFPCIQMIYNAQLFGSPFSTGYALSDEQYAFELSSIVRNLPWVLKLFAGDALPVLFGAGLIGMFCLGGARDRTLRFLWWLPLVLLYSSYYWASPRFGTAFTRFFICTIPVFIGSACALLDRLNSRRLRYLAVAGVCFSVAITHFGQAIGGMKGLVRSLEARQQELSGDKVEAHVRANAAVFASAPAACYMNRGKNIDLYDLAVFQSGYGRHFSSPRPGDPRRQPARTEKFKALYAGFDHQSLAQAQRELIQRVIENGRQAVYVIPVHRLPGEQKKLGDGFDFNMLTEWTGQAARWESKNGNYVQIPYDEQWAIYEVTLKPPVVGIVGPEQSPE